MKEVLAGGVTVCRDLVVKLLRNIKRIEASIKRKNRSRTIQSFNADGIRRLRPVSLRNWLRYGRRSSYLFLRITRSNTLNFLIPIQVKKTILETRTSDDHVRLWRLKGVAKSGDTYE